MPLFITKDYVIGTDYFGDIDPIECPIGNEGCKRDSSACGAYMGHETQNGFTKIVCGESEDFVLKLEIKRRSILATDDAIRLFPDKYGREATAEERVMLYELALEENYKLQGYVKATIQ